MMTDLELQQYLSTVDLTPEGIDYVKRAIGSEGHPAPPARNVQNKCCNVIGTYSSFKTGLGHDFESYRGERLSLMDLERRSDVVGYFAQPPGIPLSFPILHGTRTYTKPDHITDALVFCKGRIHFREVKTKISLAEYVKKGSGRFVCDKDGRWTSPPGITAAATFGIGYEVWCPEDVAPLLAQNIVSLDQVTKRPLQDLFDGDCGQFLKKVAAKPGITLEEMEVDMTRPERLAVQWLIGRGIIYAELEKALLIDKHRIRLFSDERTAKLFNAANSGPVGADDHEAPSGRVPDLSVVVQKVSMATEADKELGVRNVEWFNSGFSNCALSVRQQQRIKKCGRNSIMANGTPVPGLLGQQSRRGNWKRKLPNYVEVEKIAKETIDEKFAAKEAPVPSNVRHAINDRLINAGLKSISKKWFYKFLKKVKTGAMDEARKGTKAVYFDTFVGAGIAGVSDTRGEHPFDRVHIDHTQLDLIVVDAFSGLKLGKPWLTLMADAYLGSELAYYLSFNHPSVDSNIMLFRRLVARHEQYPFNIVTDNGSDFYSNWYYINIVTHGSTLMKRPPSKPRFGAVIERLFGVITSQLLYSLLGNTQRLKTPRQLAAKDNPGLDAIWTLPMLDSALERYFAARAQRLIPPLGYNGGRRLNALSH